MRPPRSGERQGSRQSPTTATITIKTSAPHEQPGRSQDTGRVYPKTFAEWARLMAEAPYVSPGWTP